MEKSNCIENMSLYGNDQAEFTGDEAVKNIIDSGRRIGYRYFYVDGSISQMIVSIVKKNDICPIEHFVERKAYKALVKRGLILRIYV